MIVPSGAHVAPRGSTDASAKDCAGPPMTSILRILPPEKKPIQRPSGDQKGKVAPSVPANCRDSTSATVRTHRDVPPVGPIDTKAICCPSGDKANDSLNV